jgi:hypothetical protein
MRRTACGPQRGLQAFSGSRIRDAKSRQLNQGTPAHRESSLGIRATRNGNRSLATPWQYR